MSERAPDRPAATFLDVLQAIEEAGLPVGVREHVAVSRLLDHADLTAPETIKAGLGALLARNPQEATLVRDTFDRFCRAQVVADSAPVAAAERRPPFMARLRVRWAPWGAGALAVLLSLPVLTLAWRLIRERSQTPVTLPVPPTVPPHASAPPPDLVLRDVVTPRINWWRIVGLAGIGAAFVFVDRYAKRTAREAWRFALRRWTEDMGDREGPLDYEIATSGLRPEHPPGLLDDLAAILGRHAPVPSRGGELDVDRTVAATLRAGLAPTIVWRARRATVPIVVLQDVSDEMRLWERRTEALLHGLAVRGVALDRWRFDADAGRVWRETGGAHLALRQLARRTADNPLLVIGTGEGVLEGALLHLAAWVELLAHWRSRVWLHPVSDTRLWRRTLQRVPISTWPMTPDGLVAAARQLSRGESRLGERSEPRGTAERAVTPLDVERLRWLVSLAPRADPELAEMLRQRFCPQVPAAALVPALAAPLDADRSPLGPPAAEVHAYLAEVMTASRPTDEGTSAFERWRVDRALQMLGAGERDAAVRELNAVAAGAGAPIVADSVARLAPLTPSGRSAVRGEVERAVMRPLRARARSRGWSEAAQTGESRERRWTLPKRFELVPAGIAAAVTLVAAVALGATDRLRALTRDDVVHAEEAYVLAVQGTAGQVDVRLAVAARPGLDEQRAPRTVRLFTDTGARTSLRLQAGGASAPVDEKGLGKWYQARANRADGTLAVSNLVWVPKPVQRPLPSPAAAQGSPAPSPSSTVQPEAAKPGFLLVLVDSPSGLAPARRYRITGVDRPQSRAGVTGQRLELPAGTWRVIGLSPSDIGVRITEGQVTTIRVDLGPSSLPTPSPTPSPTPIENGPVQQGPPVEMREVEAVYAEVGCEEETVVAIRYQLLDYERFVSADVEILKQDNLKLAEPGTPEYDVKQRMVIGRVRIRGLDRVPPGIGNCPGGGNITVGMRVRVAARAPAAAN